MLLQGWPCGEKRRGQGAVAESPVPLMEYRDKLDTIVGNMFTASVIMTVAGALFFSLPWVELDDVSEDDIPCDAASASEAFRVFQGM